MSRNKFGIVCFILALFSFFISIMLNYEKINIPYFNGLFTPVAVNIEITNKYQNAIKINGENFYSPRNQAKDVIISKVLNGKVEKLELDSDSTEALKNISSIDIFVGRKFYHFNQSSLKISNNKINLPFENNYKGNFNTVIVSFLALFYNLRFFVITWIFLISGFFLLEDKLEFDNKWLLACIFCFAILCRFNQFTAYPLWWDEVFVINLPASHIYPISSIFIDPGNPSFFYLIMKIYTCFAPLTIEFMRLIPVIFGSIGVLGIYILTNRFSNQKSAILATFMASVSIYHICYSQELRGYSLILLIAPFVIMSLFDYLKSSSKKNFWKLFLTSSIMINTHLFGLFLLLTNFIYGNITFIKNKEKFGKYFKFTLCHIFIFATFVPYLLINFVKTLTGREGFNTHLKETTFTLVTHIASSNFGNLLVLLFFAIFCFVYFYQNKENSSEKIYVKYGIFTLCSFWIIAILVSLIRPLLTIYYFIVLYPLYISLFAIILCKLLSKNKTLLSRIVVILVLIFILHTQTFNNSTKTECSFENITNTVNAKAKDNPQTLYFMHIQPKRIRDFYKFENNVITDTDKAYLSKIYYITRAEVKLNAPQELYQNDYQVIKTSCKNSAKML